MKALLVYYSFSGNNRLLASTLCNKFQLDWYEIKEIKRRRKFSIFLDMFFHRSPKIEPMPLSISDYNLVLLSAPIWMGTFATPLKTFLKTHGNKINNYAFISLCGVKENQHIEKHLLKLTGKKPIRITELPVDSLLPEGQKDTTDYKVSREELTTFDDEITEFIKDIRKENTAV